MRVLAIAWTLIMLYLFMAPVANLPQIRIRAIDDWFHFLGFLLFCLLWLGGYYQGKKALIVWIWLITVAFGFMVECFQLWFTEVRSFQLMDVMFDAFGATAGVAIFMLLLWARRFIFQTR